MSLREALCTNLLDLLTTENGSGHFQESTLLLTSNFVFHSKYPKSTENDSLTEILTQRLFSILEEKTVSFELVNPSGLIIDLIECVYELLVKQELPLNSDLNEEQINDCSFCIELVFRLTREFCKYDVDIMNKQPVFELMSFLFMQDIKVHNIKRISEFYR